ncbi:MAG: hypothetical protein AB4368_28655 [Xenococcaceae cyanobacterium]
MLTDLDRSIIIAVASGFIGSLSQSALEYFFYVKIDKQIKNIKQEISISLLTSIWTGIVFGISAFTLANWDTTMSVAKLNRWSIFVPLSLPLSVIINRILPLHSIFLYIFRKKNKTNN